MNHNDLQARVEALLERGQLSRAIAQVRSRVPAALRADVGDALDKISDDYALLARYALDGVDDPERPRVLARLADGVRAAAAAVDRENAAADSPTLYFNTLRYRRTSRQPDVGALVEQCLRAADHLSLAQLDGGGDAGAQRAQAEELEKQAFNALWTQHPLSHAQAGAVARALGGIEAPEHFKLLLVSALLLGELEWHDERRWRLLMDAYADPSATDALQVRALCALLLGMWRWRRAQMSPGLRARFDALAELPHYADDVRQALLQFIRTRDAERISREFNEDILPQMRDMAPQLRRIIDETEGDDPEAAMEDPRWEELMEQSGLGEKLRKMQEWQEEGADVMMTTFQHLKSFPFFNEISNWFLPFHTGHSAVARASAEPGLAALGQMLADAGIMCDGDKYSAVLSLDVMPDAAKKTFLGQMSAYGEQMEQARGDAPKASRQNIANKYVQDLNRFYRMFRRREEFYNPFASPVNLPAHPLLAPVFDDAATLRLVGEFYLKRGHWADAEGVLERLGQSQGPTAEVLQKLGYCRQKQGDPARALQYYEQAELLDDAPEWTLRRMAACHRALGDHAGALECYRRLAQARPDDPALEISMGNACLATRDWGAALKHYFKAEYLAPGDGRTLRPIAWASLMEGNLERARQYYDKLLAQPDPEAADLLNAGHLELLSGDRRAALECWRGAARRDPDFADMLRADIPMLRSRGVPDDIIGIISDQI